MNDNEQRDEWARLIVGELHPGPQDDPMTWPAQVWRLADAIVEKIKPRTITTVEELDALSNGTTLNVMAGQPFPVYRWDDCWNFPVGYGSWCDSKKLLVAWGGKGFTVLHEPTTEATR